MNQTPPQRWQISELFISLFVFLIVCSYTYALLFLDPYPGFAFNNTNGRVVEIYVQTEQGKPTLQIDDVILKIGSIAWEAYRTDATVQFFEGVQKGNIVEIIVSRNGKDIVIPWNFMGFEQKVFESRLLNMWVLSYLFWFAGATAIVLIRPRDLLRNLFVTMNYITALWLIFGMLSHSHLWGSSILLHAITWLLLPVYLHFHWVFPHPLKQLPKSIAILIYFICSCFALAEFFQALPKSLYALAFLFALLGSFIIEILHYIKHKDQRRDVKLIALAIVIAFLPAISLGILIITGSVPNIAALALIALPFMPLAYFYGIYRRQLGGLELRLNRIISLYVFLILIGTVLVILTIPFISLKIKLETGVAIGIMIALALIYFAVTTFPKFQKFVEKRFLGIKLDNQILQQEYIKSIVTCTSLNSLLQLLEEETFPSLFIRQYVVVQNTTGNLKALLTKNVSASEMPDETATNYLLERSGKFIPNVLSDDWMRLILPLQVGDSTLGFLLLGQRDPDDLYHQSEIPILQSITNQTAVALSNILYAEQLKQMYQVGMQRYEAERSRLGRDLHDRVLNVLGDLHKNLGEDVSTSVQTSYQQAVNRLREIINDLRPPMLMYGLALALQGLAESVMQKTDDQIKVIIDLQSTDERLPENIEVQLFWIIYEACENSVRHAKASCINISGSLSSDKAELFIEDDGIGFDMSESWNLNNIIANRHFGLVGMLERAHVIGAKLNIEPKPHTKVHMVWDVDKI